MMLLPTPLLLAAVVAAPSTLLPTVQSLSIKPSPPLQPPKSFSSRSGRGPATTPGWRSDTRQRHNHQSSTLHAYTVADSNKPSWLSLLKFPTFELGPRDSLFSFEGGAMEAVARRPLMPNLDTEVATITAANMKMEKEGLLSELATLKENLAGLRRPSETAKTYEYKVESLEEKNTLLEEGLVRMTVTLKQQEQMLQKLHQEKKEEKSANNDVNLFVQLQDNVKALEGDNEMLRNRLRGLELELSEVAFESRKLTSTPHTSTVANQQDASVDESVDSAKLSPKAPSVPVPPHIIYQQLQFEKLQSKVKQYERERSSVRKLFGLGIRRGVNKVGRALNLWNPVYNLLLWGELRGQGKVW
eukprot:CAMPEP_0181133994 /NCGR_PEP_ID=MMETSP1071-20121207/31824_1 /TAXON_ID=35127 /ORGANISM="Thalassiosira sp., Strain NH16" /LENGTH=357 /DNA_ID=CAMNT_0023220429 /DNA_START=49 /DNA_END=1120 /DNA_ORIENTATION=+